MTLDPKAKAFLDMGAAAGEPPMSTLTPQQNRERTAGLQALSGEPKPLAKVESRMIPVEGGEIELRIYTPEGPGTFPLFVYFHGGGWVIGDVETVDTVCRNIAHESECVVASVNYRLAPEHKFPVPVEDCYTAVQWVSEHAQEINGDASRLAIGGDSAGGNLAAVISQLAKERTGPAISLQVLVYPVTQVGCDTESYRENGEGYFLTADSMQWFFQQYLNADEEKSDVRVSPLLAADLSGLPPALVITAEYDPLRDEGEMYAERLKQAGVPVELTRYDGMIHGFFWMAGIMDQGAEAISQVSNRLRSVFERL
ncbi:alpha/beta hydrolase [Brevibacillus choshinensis]|uniref:Alpha/beta hydrolase n=1 Tax=Brevibacillus choshinensis TaxID=54911 RepID=A0ABX7FU08_BRECH|nr:alpha/beta hydrolase [Brevibacillus choshinensis]QRG69230.1 alpha/beta hydrolase [Brevibacillus choshinensis]